MTYHDSVNQTQTLPPLQRVSLGIMAVLAVMTFFFANFQALLWQSSNWLVSTVLPAVVVDLTNQERLANNEVKLQRNATLDEAARLKAEHMVENEYFSHFSPDGVSPWYWFDEADYVYAHAGENLAIHFTDSSELVEAWMNSPAHRKNITNNLYTEIGVGTARGTYDGYETVYVVQLFGTPAVDPIIEVDSVPTVVTEVFPVETIDEAVATEELPDENVVETKVLSASSSLLEETEIGVVDEKVDEIDIKALPDSVTEDFVVESEPFPEPVDQFMVTNDMESVDQRDVTVISDEIFIIKSPVISTSSGLAVANITTSNHLQNEGGLASVATRPNMMLQMVYLVLGAMVLIMLVISVIRETRRLHYVHAVHGLILLFAMAGLWLVNSWLTHGAVIV